jgi:hypothetical protein
MRHECAQRSTCPIRHLIRRSTLRLFRAKADRTWAAATAAA